MNEYRPHKNFDNELIDYEASLMDKLTYETASLGRRISAFLVDLIIILLIWVLCTNHLYDDINKYVAELGVDEADFLDIAKLEKLRDILWKLYFDLYLVFIIVQFVYYTIVPALIGGGRTIGKCLAGLRMVSIKTLDEIPPRYLVLREFIGRTIIETILVFPIIISAIVTFFRKDGRSIHDLVAKTIVIRSDLYDMT